MKIGFIGTGNMGGALAQAVARTGYAEVLLADKAADKAAELAERIGAKAVDVTDVAAEADYIFLGVKPQVMELCLAELKDILASRKDRFVLVTMAAGMKMEKILSLAGGSYPIIRIMPNTPVSIGKGVILMCASGEVTAEEKNGLKKALSMAGIVDELSENLFEAGTAVSGCGPAYVYMCIEALADGGVQCGLPRDKAMLYAAAMLEGSAALVQSSGKHPGELKDAVCSPGGSTIAGVHALEMNGFRNALMDAVEAGYERTKELG
ncbi:MAG: pyrroline-5-carboxylate reductase [Lachnospiraceae bacterium]|nr:pyrroline-5-carboxylate reductase [Lachnospiraceae bacterium]